VRITASGTPVTRSVSTMSSSSASTIARFVVGWRCIGGGDERVPSCAPGSHLERRDKPGGVADPAGAHQGNAQVAELTHQLLALFGPAWPPARLFTAMRPRTPESSP